MNNFLDEAIKETSKAQIETAEFEISTISMLNTKLHALVEKATDDNKTKIQDLVETHIKRIAKLEVQIDMFKLFSKI